jgi:cell division FtsZ-interacting protein ZapD
MSDLLESGLCGLFYWLHDGHQELRCSVRRQSTMCTPLADSTLELYANLILESEYTCHISTRILYDP